MGKLIPIIERAQDHYRESGRFLVISRNNVREFDRLINAYQFYYILEREASLWDITGKEILLEKKKSV